MSLATKSIVSMHSESGHPEAALNSSVLDRMMDAMTSPFLNGRRAESIKNGRKVHPGAFIFSIAVLLTLCLSVHCTGQVWGSKSSTTSSIETHTAL